MSKELEALNDLFDLVTCQDSFEKAQRCFDIVEQALQRLESIDNANPSEALECLEKLELLTCDFEWYKDNINTIKQALIKAEKEHNSINLLMQELDCKDFAELRKYARCGYQTFRNAKGANYDNIIIDEAVIPSEAIVEKSLKALEILKRNVKVSIDYGEEGKDISMALVVYIDNKKTIYVVDEAIKEQNPEHFKELELLKEVLE